MDVADPVKLRRLVMDTLQAAGIDQATIAQVLEVESMFMCPRSFCPAKQHSSTGGGGGSCVAVWFDLIYPVCCDAGVVLLLLLLWW